MNTKWMQKFAVVINGEYIDMIRYVFPLNEEHKLRERKRIGKRNRAAFKNVELVRISE